MAKCVVVILVDDDVQSAYIVDCIDLGLYTKERMRKEIHDRVDHLRGDEGNKFKVRIQFFIPDEMNTPCVCVPDRVKETLV